MWNVLNRLVHGKPRDQKYVVVPVEIPLFKQTPAFFKQVRGRFLRFLSRFKKRKEVSFRGSKKRKSISTERAGRSIKTVRFREGENTVALLASVVTSVFNGKYNLETRRFAIEKRDFVGWKRLERESITLILLVDLSHSTFAFVNMFAEIIDSLTSYFKMHQDRIGLISLQGTQAQVLNHPTHNYRIIAKNLLALRIHGQTPLADGLLKALTMVRLERFRKPGSRSLVILISDCYPEPISGMYEDILEEPAYRETLRTASLYKKLKTQLLVINPSFKNKVEAEYLPGERLATIVARESKGKLIKIHRDDVITDKTSFIAPTRGEINQILTGIESMLGTKVSEDMIRVQT